MAAGSITHNVGTTFTVGGIQQAISQFRRVATSFRDRMQSMRQAAAAASRAIVDRLKQITAFSWSKLQAGAKKAFDAIKLGALGVVAAIGGIATAAIHSTKELAELFNTVDKQSKALGMKPEDTSVLRYTLEQNGVEADEILPNLSTMIFEFKAIKDAIDGADESWAKTADWNLKEAMASGTADAVFSARDGNRAAAATSFAGIQFRQDQIRQQIETSGQGQDGYRLDLVKEYKQLQSAKDALEGSFGPVGTALFKLRDAGLDLDRAMKPGMDSLYAVAEAFQKVTDPAEKLTISMGIFGGDAGAKMIPVLEQGRVGIDKYRKELERLGGVVTERDTQLAHEYQESVRRRQMAIQGTRATVFRELAPQMTDANSQFTEFLVSNRDKIADVFKAGFAILKNIAVDTFAFIEGKRSGFSSNWINSLIDGFQRVKSFAFDVMTEVQKAFTSQNSRFDWLNMLAYGIEQAKTFAVDLFTVLNGGSAETFEWLNDLKSGFDEFAKRLKEAWELFKGVLDTIHGLIKPILDFLGIDPTTAVLLLGMLRLSGILGGVVTLVGTLFSGFSGLLGLGAGGGALASGLGTLVAGLGTVAASLGLVVAAVGVAGVVAYQVMERVYDKRLQLLTDAVRQAGDMSYDARQTKQHNRLMGENSVEGQDYRIQHQRTNGISNGSLTSKEIARYTANPELYTKEYNGGDQLRPNVFALREAQAMANSDRENAALRARPSSTVHIVLEKDGRTQEGYVSKGFSDMLTELGSSRR
ncbi:hypothetical protein O9X99_01935 [Agrobacterium salinitolerans]|uniref:Phage tail tape measure protein n=1 Tax=Agrobacterium salinitolerans TaxID=1183413 RepID=A0ABY3BWT3_9HYPH|nr:MULTISPECIES: hypothetical protein [Agrobacterium]MCZ7890427.1 hypothetical protein [Agrobacterium salinitolerans]TRA96851.1 hypothetical protein EXN23_01020 [Agrobacterium salinitolerans]